MENGDAEEVAKLLENGHSVKETHKLWTPIMKACEEGHTEIAKNLLEYVCDIEAVIKHGRSAVSFTAASSMGRTPCLPVLQLLLKAKADVSHKDSRGETARARVIGNGHTQSVALINAFVQQPAANGLRRKPLHHFSLQLC